MVDWEYLKPHFESGALIYVDTTLSITEVGQSLADDDKDKIQAWLKSGDLVNPQNLMPNGGLRTRKILPRWWCHPLC